MATLGALERTVMEILWENARSLNANELRELLISRVSEPNSAAFVSNPEQKSITKDPAVTTILTVLSRLEKKGLVVRERTGRPHSYRSLLSREEHTARLMGEVLGQAPNREAVLARFLGTVSPSEIATLRKLLAGS